MDQYDDFEFKPITDGLGFHKKGSRSTVSSERMESKDFGLDPKSLAKAASAAASPFLGTTLPRASQAEIPKFEQKKFKPTTSLNGPINIQAGPDVITPAIKKPEINTPLSPTIKPTSSELINKKLAELSMANNTKQALSFTDNNYVEVSGHFGAYLFDLVVVLGLSCLFALSLTLITEIDLLQVLNTITFDIGIQVGTGLLVASVIALYLTLSRSFFASTLGEWAFDLQLGKKADQEKTFYPIYVFWRTALVLVTGLVVLPLISMVLQKDITSRFSGLKLYKQ